MAEKAESSVETSAWPTLQPLIQTEPAAGVQKEGMCVCTLRWPRVGGRRCPETPLRLDFEDNVGFCHLGKKYRYLCPL